MKITYIYHSGFAVEFDRAVLVFDYFRGELPTFSPAGEKGKPVYLFSSHHHYDHFKREILTWKEKMNVAAWILSKDIGERKLDFPKEDVYFMEAGETLTLPVRDREAAVGTITVRTLCSTDEGVAYVVTVWLDGKKKVLYHAGDLNWWHWEEESPAYQAAMKENFQREIHKIEGMTIDAAFVPLDGRLLDAYSLGADYLMRHTDTQLLFPMHLWKDYGLCERFRKDPVSAPYRSRIAVIKEKGQQFLVR